MAPGHGPAIDPMAVAQWLVCRDRPLEVDARGSPVQHVTVGMSRCDLEEGDSHDVDDPSPSQHLAVTCRAAVEGRA